MAKSVVSALVGILAGQGRIRIDEPAPVPEWADGRDPRHAITPSQLLRMSSGLAWTETYGEQPVADVNRMLFLEPDMARFAAGLPLATVPDTAFHYSSGSTNILCRIMRGLFASREEYLAFPHRALFERIGIRDAAWGTDASGTIVGSSYLFATARDFARFGMLCLADGVWQGERILPEGWMKWATTPTPTDPSAEYGAGFWLNRDPARHEPDPRLPEAAGRLLLRQRPPGADDRRHPIPEAGRGAARHDVGQRVGQGGVPGGSARGLTCGPWT